MDEIHYLNSRKSIQRFSSPVYEFFVWKFFVPDQLGCLLGPQELLVKQLFCYKFKNINLKVVGGLLNATLLRTPAKCFPDTRHFAETKCPGKKHLVRLGQAIMISVPSIF